MSLFGTGLLERKKTKVVEQLEHLFDFALGNDFSGNVRSNNTVNWSVPTTGTATMYTGGGITLTSAATAYIIPETRNQIVGIVDSGQSTSDSEEVEEEIKEPPKDITPKELFDLGVLNQLEMSIDCSAEYVYRTIRLLEDKLSLIRGDGQSRRESKKELEALIEPIENRRRFEKFKDRVGQYPHTTSEAIASVLQQEDHLRCKKTEEFVPDFPEDAIAAMKDYESMCIELCGKLPEFYIIADKKDFKPAIRRDPILLAQSPFGFFWQILGAWDEEMIFLEDL